MKFLDIVEYGAFLGWILYKIALIFFSLKRIKASGGGNDFFSMGKTNIKPYGIEKKISIRFKDVAGQDEAKLEITEFVEFLKRPDKYFIF